MEVSSNSLQLLHQALQESQKEQEQDALGKQIGRDGGKPIMAKGYETKNDKHKDKPVWIDRQVESLLKITLEYKCISVGNVFLVLDREAVQYKSYSGALCEGVVLKQKQNFITTLLAN